MPAIFMPLDYDYQTEPTIEKVLILSTCHVDGRDEYDPKRSSPKQNDVSQLHDDGPLISYENAYGWFICVNPTGEPNFILELRKEGVSENILKLLCYAEDLGCKWIKLDRDGPVMEGLPTFHW